MDSPDEDGEVGLAIPFEMFKEYVVVQDAGNVAGVAALDEPLHIPAADGEPEEYVWTLKVTQAIVDGRSVLVSFSICLLPISWFICILYCYLHSFFLFSSIFLGM